MYISPNRDPQQSAPRVPAIACNPPDFDDSKYDEVRMALRIAEVLATSEGYFSAPL